MRLRITFLTLVLFVAVTLAASMDDNIQTGLRAQHVTVLESKSDFTTLEISLGDYTESTLSINGKEYLQLGIPSEAFRNEAGMPELPLLARSIAIPPMAKMNWEIISSEYTEFAGHVAPAKGNFSRKIDPSTVPYTFSDVYSQDAFFPENIVELCEPYIMREIRGQAIRITPFTYNPAQGIIRYYHHIVVKVYADGIDTVNTMPTRSSRITADFEDIYQSRFINYNQEITRYNPIKEKGSMLIIAHQPFMEAMEPYVEWKKQKGMKVNMVSVSSIGGNTASSIQNYIANQYNTNSDLAFILLVGDATQIARTTYGSYSSDPTYVMLAGNDQYPDALIGRFSAETVAELTTQIVRTIHYERDIDANSGAWLSNATGIASAEGPNSAHPQKDYEHMEVVRTVLLAGGDYNNIDKFYQGNNAGGTHATVANVSAALNEGRGLLNYVAHGSWDSWGFQAGYGGAFEYHINNVNALTNHWKLPFVVSVACDVGIFHDRTCFAETWMRATNNGNPTGAIAFYGATMSQYWTPPMFAQDHIAEQMRDHKRNTIGGLFFDGSCYMLDVSPSSDHIETFRTWHIFGDPSLMFRTKAPTAFNIASIPSEIFLHEDYFTLNVGEKDALVSLYSPESKLLIASAYSNNSGIATIPIANHITYAGNAILTVTGFNKVTYQTPVTIFDHIGPVIKLDTYNLSNARFDYGSTVDLAIKLKNTGIGNSTVLTATLDTNDRYVEMLLDEIEIPGIAAGASGSTQQTFVFKIALDVPDQHIADFILSVTDGDFIWNFPVELTMNAPVMKLAPGGAFITTVPNEDKAGNTTTILKIPFQNIGGARSPEGVVNLRYSNPNITVPSDNVISAVGGNSIGFAEIEISTESELPTGYLNFIATAEIFNQPISGFVAAAIGASTENFELGVLPDNTVGATTWAISTDAAYEGIYSLGSPETMSGRTSSFAIEKRINYNGYIGFMYKVSDNLEFYINNVKKASYSGETDWAYAVFEVKEGVNTFNWVYTKTATAGEPEKRAWIDNIIFPLDENLPKQVPMIAFEHDSFELSDTKIDEEVTSRIVIENFGTAILGGIITLPTGFTFDDLGAQLIDTYFINPGETKTYSIVFKPTEVLDYSGEIKITSNDTNCSVYKIAVNADMTNVSSEDDVATLVTQLHGNYPNPFNPTTSFDFTLAKPEIVNITVFNVKGQRVTTVVNKGFTEGNHKVVWNGKDDNGRDAGSGVYFYHFSAGEYKSIQKMLLMK